MNKSNYSGGLTREQFLFREMRITAGLYIDGLEDDDIIERIYTDNLFQYPTEKMLKTLARACIRRIKALDNTELTEIIAHGSYDTAKQAVLYSIMCENTIVRDFMIDVIGEKYRTQCFDYSRTDINIFFDQLFERVPDALKWSESTVGKIKQVLTKILVECEYLEDTRSAQLLPVYLYPEVERGIIDNGDFEALPAFNCLNGV